MFHLILSQRELNNKRQETGRGKWVYHSISRETNFCR